MTKPSTLPLGHSFAGSAEDEQCQFCYGCYVTPAGTHLCAEKRKCRKPRAAHNAPPTPVPAWLGHEFVRHMAETRCPDPGSCHFGVGGECVEREPAHGPESAPLPQERETPMHQRSDCPDLGGCDGCMPNIPAPTKPESETERLVEHHRRVVLSLIPKDKIFQECGEIGITRLIAAVRKEVLKQQAEWVNYMYQQANRAKDQTITVTSYFLLDQLQRLLRDSR